MNWHLFTAISGIANDEVQRRKLIPHVGLLTRSSDSDHQHKASVIEETVEEHYP
jgi:hypothetical protein